VRSRLCTIGVLASAALCACSAPQAPCDRRATSNFNFITVSCTPAGSDARCTATAVNNNLYTCGPTSLDVTNSAVFVSSDPSIAALGSGPGYISAVGAGSVTITAEWSNLSSTHLRWYFEPGVASERMVDLVVGVRDAVTSATIAGAAITVTPDHGVPQTCTGSQFGSCTVYVRHGVLLISASTTNYQPGEVRLETGATSVSLSTVVFLTPKSP
jgi:hypothetical protein